MAFNVDGSAPVSRSTPARGTHPISEARPAQREESGVTLDAFMASALSARHKSNEEQRLEEVFWRAVFQRYDANGSGMLSDRELRKLAEDHPDLAYLVNAKASNVDGQFAQDPYLMRLMQDVQVGDLVFVKGTGVVAAATRSEWTHVAMCVEKGPPPKFVEAVGMTGGAGSRGGVRESDFFQFVSDSDLLTTGKAGKFSIVRPSTDPREIAAAVRFAREQVGKPYDFAFRNNNGKYYCSELVYDAYNHNPYMPTCPETPLLGLEKSRSRDVLVDAAKGLARALFGSEESAGRLIERFMLRDSQPGPRRATGGSESTRNQRHGFVSPTDVLNGSRTRIVGTYEPSPQQP